MKKSKILSYLLGPVGSGILGLVSLPIITWFYSVEDIGKISMLQVFSSFMTLLFCLGLDQAYVREYHESKIKPRLFKASFLPGFTLLLICSFGLYFSDETLLSNLLYKENNKYLTILSLLCFVLAFCSRFLSLILRMEERAIAYSMSQLLPKISFLTLILCIVWLGLKTNFYSLILAHSLSITLVFFVFAWNTRLVWLRSLSQMIDIEELKKQLAKVPNMEGLELASKVSTKEPYYFGDENATYKVAALDIGIKKNILRNIASRDTYIKVFPYNAKFEDLEAFKPDGYFLSNGPGDPEPLVEAQEVAKEIIKRDLPLFGICLGHQVIAQANGVSTYKMHNGHRGINHPVKNLITGKGEITSQNHGFAVNREEAEANSDLEITHVHLNDNTVAGLKMKNKNVFSVQYHPEASPGPNDSVYLFDQFIENLKK